MKETRHYEVAGHRFCVSGEAECFALMYNYRPFGCDEGDVVFSLNIARGAIADYAVDWRQEDDDQEIVCDIPLRGKPCLNLSGRAFRQDGSSVLLTIVRGGLSRQAAIWSWPSILR